MSPSQMGKARTEQTVVHPCAPNAETEATLSEDPEFKTSIPSGVTEADLGYTSLKNKIK